jgi:hypothetical protein
MATTTINVNASFTGLADTPSSYTGQAGKAVFVKLDETGLEFGTAGGGDNLFTANLTLGANRTHDMNGNSMTFLKSKVEFRASDGLSANQAVTVRNHTNDANLFQVNNDGSTAFVGLSKTVYYGASGSGPRISTNDGSNFARMINFNIYGCQLESKLDAQNQGINGVDYINMNGGFDADPRCFNITHRNADPTVAMPFTYKMYGKNVGSYGIPHFFMYNYITDDKYTINLARETTAVASATFVANSGTAVNDASTFDGYTIAQVVKTLKNRGLLA